MLNPKKIKLLQMMRRPFFEASAEDISRMLIETAFAATLIEEDVELPTPFSEVEHPIDFIHAMQTDLINELVLRN